MAENCVDTRVGHYWSIPQVSISMEIDVDIFSRVDNDIKGQLIEIVDKIFWRQLRLSIIL